jgi:hypothetical protein
VMGVLGLTEAAVAGALLGVTEFSLGRHTLSELGMPALPAWLVTVIVAATAVILLYRSRHQGGAQ